MVFLKRDLNLKKGHRLAILNIFFKILFSEKLKNKDINYLY
jgi:hypothetical protein